MSHFHPPNGKQPVGPDRRTCRSSVGTTAIEQLAGAVCQSDPGTQMGKKRRNLGTSWPHQVPHRLGDRTVAVAFSTNTIFDYTRWSGASRTIVHVGTSQGLGQAPGVLPHPPGPIYFMHKIVSRRHATLDSRIVMVEIELLGISEIAEILGVTRQRAGQIIQTYDDFPAPAAELSIGRVWYRTDIEQWDKTHPRRPGRPSG